MGIHDRHVVPRLPDEALRLSVSDPLAGVRRAVPREVVVEGEDAIGWRLRESLLYGDDGKDQRFVPQQPDDRPHLDGHFVDGGDTRGVLTAFTKLGDATPQAIRLFAERWGVLGVCAKHALPGVHGRCWPAEYRAGPGVGELWFVDDCSAYRKLARQFASALRIAKALADGESSERADWEWLYEGAADLALEPTFWKDRKPYPTAILALWLTGVVRDAGIAIRISDDPASRTFRTVLDLGGSTVRNLHEGGMAFVWPRGSLYPVVVAQLLAAVTQGERLEECAICHEVFDWADAGYERRPQHGRGAYCSAGCRKGAQSASTNKYRRSRRDRVE